MVMVSLATIAATSETARSSRSVARFLLPHCLVAAAILTLPLVALPLFPHYFVVVLAVFPVLQVALSRNESKTALSAFRQIDPTA